MSVKTIKAGWVKAPCTLAAVPGLTALQAVMKVQRIERDEENTTFIGVFAWVKNKGDRLTVPNSEYVHILKKRK